MIDISSPKVIVAISLVIFVFLFAILYSYFGLGEKDKTTNDVLTKAFLPSFVVGCSVGLGIYYYPKDKELRFCNEDFWESK